jgi:hypothetical protein
MLKLQSDHGRYAVTLTDYKHNDGEQCTMRKYATQRLIAKDVPVHLKGLFEGQNLRFRGRGSRVKAVETVMNSKTLRDKYLWEGWKSVPLMKIYKGLQYRFNQDLPLEFADSMSVYSR